jgi:hypothetical protein
MSTASQVNGDTAKVTLTASGTTDSGHWSLDGGCFVGPSDEDFPYPCGGDPVYFGLVGTPLSGLDKTSTITVVKQNGRWFVSPVSTVLDVLDHFISQLDRRSLFTLLDIPNQIPPDGPLTLGRPIVLPAGTSQGTKVFTFQGHEGQNLLGLATAQSKPSSTASSYENYPPAAVRMFAPDGSEFGESGMLDGQSLTLPSNGTYTVVVQRSYLSRRVGDVTVTIWDAADAPAAAKQPHDGGSSCTYTLLGASCSSTSSGSSSSIDRILPGNNSGQPSTNDRRVTATSVARGPSPTFAIPTTVPHG